MGAAGDGTGRDGAVRGGTGLDESYWPVAEKVLKDGGQVLIGKGMVLTGGQVFDR